MANEREQVEFMRAWNFEVVRDPGGRAGVVVTLPIGRVMMTPEQLGAFGFEAIAAAGSARLTLAQLEDLSRLLRSGLVVPETKLELVKG